MQGEVLGKAGGVVHGRWRGRGVEVWCATDVGVGGGVQGR